jgi:hypothetical protein
MSSSWLALSSPPAKSEPMSSSSLSLLMVCRDGVRQWREALQCGGTLDRTHSAADDLLVVKVVGDRVGEWQLGVSDAIELGRRAQESMLAVRLDFGAPEWETHDALGLDGVLLQFEQLVRGSKGSVFGQIPPDVALTHVVEPKDFSERANIGSAGVQTGDRCKGKERTLALLAALVDDAVKHALLKLAVVADARHLLLVELARVDVFFDGAGRWRGRACRQRRCRHEGAASHAPTSR